MDSMPLLEWLANNYKSYGAALEIVTDRSQEGAQFVRGFGGIGGNFGYVILFGLTNVLSIFCCILPNMHLFTGLLRYRVDFQLNDLNDGIEDINLDDY